MRTVYRHERRASDLRGLRQWPNKLHTLATSGAPPRPLPRPKLTLAVGGGREGHFQQQNMHHQTNIYKRERERESNRGWEGKSPCLAWRPSLTRDRTPRSAACATAATTSATATASIASTARPHALTVGGTSVSLVSAGPFFDLVLCLNTKWATRKITPTARLMYVPARTSVRWRRWVRWAGGWVMMART